MKTKTTEDEDDRVNPPRPGWTGALFTLLEQQFKRTATLREMISKKRRRKKKEIEAIMNDAPDTDI